MFNTVTYAHTWVSDESPISSRFKVNDHVVCATETRADRAFCVSTGRTPHDSKGQYSGLRGSKRTRFTNKPAQQALFERLCTNTADRKRTTSHRIGAVEEESNGYARGSVSQSLVATWPKSLEVSLLGLFYCDLMWN